MLGEEVTRACRPRYRIEPHSSGLTHVGAAIFWRLHAPQWSGMPAGFDLRVRPRVSTRVTLAEGLGDQVARVDAGDAGEAGAQAHARLLGDQHEVGRTPAERLGPAAGERGRPYAGAVVAGPAHA